MHDVEINDGIIWKRHNNDQLLVDKSLTPTSSSISHATSSKSIDILKSSNMYG